MDKKVTGILSYITLVGWLVAYFAGDREGARFHLNQSLVLFLANVIANLCSFIPVIGSVLAPILNIVLLIFWIIGLIYACQDKEKEIPLLGSIKILK